MAADDIGEIYKTKIPGLEDAADIQEALRLYHYGSLSYNINNTDTNVLPNPSIARHLDNIQGQIDDVDSKRTAGDVLNSEPSSPDDGFLWVDSSSLGTENIVYSTVFYSNTAPTQDLVDGIIWVDKSDPLNTLYIWDAGLNDWVTVNEFDSVITTKGDLLVVNDSGNLERLPVGANDFVLTANSSESTGLSWTQPETDSKEILHIMGVY